MTKRTYAKLIGAVVLAAAIGGCGASTTTNTPPSAGSRPAPTAVPQPLALYASAAKPTLESSIGMVKQLMASMRSSDMETVGTNCSTTGPTLANLYSAFQSASGPSSALVASRPAGIGYKWALSAIDECGMAVDTNSKSQLKVSYYDMKYGLSKLQKASSALTTWTAASHG